MLVVRALCQIYRHHHVQAADGGVVTNVLALFPSLFSRHVSQLTWLEQGLNGPKAKYEEIW